MKGMYLSLPVAILAVGILTACATTSEHQASAIEAEQNDPLTNHREVVLAARGLSCPLCASNVDRVMTMVDGVSSVQTDLEKGHIIIGLEENHAVTRGQLINAVEDAGFTFVEFVPSGA